MRSQFIVVRAEFRLSKFAFPVHPRTEWEIYKWEGGDSFYSIPIKARGGHPFRKKWPLQNGVFIPVKFEFSIVTGREGPLSVI